MKKKVLYASAIIILSYVTFVFIYHVVPVVTGRFATTHFMANLKSNDPTAASRYIYSNERQEWVNKFSELEKDGLSLVDYRGLQVGLDDNALEGSVYVTLTNQSIKKEYRIFIIFDGGRLTPKISHLQYMEADGVDETIEQWIRAMNFTVS
ncbi:hypothetical protein [Paenibacillus planticolens]|uniref:DUF4825 domain-containing protein n=1 Tax=Paenibacillus planticolens TaxID=2654976 RepID=A0ABX1ZHL1_9BACL|nr:hypothetical protein [Paenibacillus planticolens]NOU99566.1 hypothetical protein [Paenibacillus planticolens]